MQDFKKLVVWQRSFNFSVEVYKCTRDFPKEEKYGLTSQLRRACSSIPINISEGAGRQTNKEFTNFVQIAIGSAYEADCELLICKELHYLAPEQFEALYADLQDIKRMLTTFVARLRERANS